MYKYLKRIFDIILAIMTLIIFIIPMTFIAIAIKIESKGPVLFKQLRTGYKGKNFYLYKFRSMSNENNVMDFNSENKITKIGKLIRTTSLDELPQIINVLKGEMSFIGPRPWIPEYYKYFTKVQKKRVEVLPGITGLAQALGRNTLEIFEKINLDIKYVNEYSFIEDLKVIYWTFKTVFSKEGAEIGKFGIKSELDDLKDNFLSVTVSSPKIEKNIIENYIKEG
ncbi:MAG: sugar transferase [Clostridia bacterium]